MAAATPPYVPVDREVVVDDDMTEANIIIQSLHWIGFRQNNQRQNIIDDSLGSFADIRIGTCPWKKGFTVVVVREHLTIGRNAKLINQMRMIKCLSKLIDLRNIIGQSCHSLLVLTYHIMFHELHRCYHRRGNHMFE